MVILKDGPFNRLCKGQERDTVFAVCKEIRNLTKQMRQLVNYAVVRNVTVNDVHRVAFISGPLNVDERPRGSASAAKLLQAMPQG
jgi:hypothetical protein